MLRLHDTATAPESVREPSSAGGVVVDALRWEILTCWAAFLDDERFPHKDDEAERLWGFVRREMHDSALWCLWELREMSYPAFAEAVWLLRRDFCHSSEMEGYPLMRGMLRMPEELLYRKLAYATVEMGRGAAPVEVVAELEAAPGAYERMR